MHYAGLIGTFALTMLLIGCSRNEIKQIVYNAEKLYHQAERLREAASIKPELIDSETIRNMKSAYSKVADYCWSNIPRLPAEQYPDENKDLSSIAFLSVNRLSQLYFAQREFDSVIIIIEKLVNFANLEGMPLLSSKLSLGRALQASGNLDKAMDVYYSLVDTFYPPIDNNNNIITQVLNLPAEIVGVFTLMADSSGIAIQRQAAENYYRRLLTEWPNSELELAARNNLAKLYFEEKSWDEAIRILEEVKDTLGHTKPEVKLKIAEILLEGKKKPDEAIRILDELLLEVNDTILVPTAMMYKGMAYFAKKNYQLCRESMSQIDERFSYFFASNPMPQKYIALSFKNLGDWRRAENEFQWLIDNYPTSEAAFDAYLEIFDHYLESRDVQLANNWKLKAEGFYSQMAERFKNTNIEASAYSYMAELSRRQNNWETAVRFLMAIYERFPSTEIGRNSLLKASTVYRDKLDNPAKADSLVERLKAELFPMVVGKNINVMTDDNN